MTSPNNYGIIFIYAGHERFLSGSKNGVFTIFAGVNFLKCSTFNSKSKRVPIFEYFASKKPILCFGPKESDVKNLLENNYGIYHAYQQQSNVIKNDILSLFNQEFEFNDIEKDKYSRKYLTKN